MVAPMQQKRGGNPYMSIQRLPCQNNSSTNTIPPFGLVRVVGTNADGALLVDQPNADGQDVYLNGPTAILPNQGPPLYRGGCGVVTKSFPIWAQYDPTSGMPAIGQTWGAKAGSYLLTYGRNGFAIQGSPVSANGQQGPPRVLIVPSTLPLSFIAVSQTAPKTIYLGRSVTDAVLKAGSNVFSSASANFTSADIGLQVLGFTAGSPDGTIPASPPTTITAINTTVSPPTAILSAPATANVTGETVAILTGTTAGFPAAQEVWNGPTGLTNHQWTFTGSSACWFLSTNSPDPASPYTVAPHNQFPLPGTMPIEDVQRVGLDAFGVAIFVWIFDPGTWYDVAASTGPGYMSGGAVVVYGLGSNPSQGGSTTGRITCGASSILVGAMVDNGAAYGPDLYVAPGPYAVSQGVAGIPYLGDTGQDAVGNQIVNGLVVSIGGGTGVISAPSDYGTWSG